MHEITLLMFDGCVYPSITSEVGGGLVMLGSVYICFPSYDIIMKSMLLSVLVWFGD